MLNASTAITQIRRAVAAVIEPGRRYRPELHYMRGPGPATLAKRPALSFLSATPAAMP